MGHLTDNPSTRPRLRLSLNPWTVYGGIGLLIMLKWFVSTF